MDNILSEFIAKTSCEPGFARDLLNHHNWNLGQTLRSYYELKDMNGTMSTIDENLTIITKTATAKLGIGSPTPTDAASTNNQAMMKESLVTNGSATRDSLANLVASKFVSEPSLSSQSEDVCDSAASKVLSPLKLANGHLNEVLFNEKKLTRGISRASNNVNLVSKARSEFAQDFQTSSRGSRLLNVDGFLETPEFTFTLPDISIHDDDFREFLRKDLIEKTTLTSLESAKRLNWWSDVCQSLYPLVTSGDGMWGFHDRELTLRRALYILLSNSSYTRSFYRRWRWQTHFTNTKTGLTYSETEWESEWDNILRMASTEPRSKNHGSEFDINGGKKEPNEYEERTYTYESLEEIHIFALAHVLRRPIIVIADTMLKDMRGEAFYPIPFGGLYLPFECPTSCLMKSPLCLTYDAAHFSALVAMNSMDKSRPELPLAIPLMDVDHKILPLHFAIDPGEDTFTQKAPEKLFDSLAKSFVLTEQDKIELLKKYFDIVTLAHFKENCVEVKKRSSGDITPPLVVNGNLKVPPSTVEKSQTLPINFGRKSNEFANGSSDTIGKTLVRKSSYLLQRPFVTFGRMSKRIKKNIGHLARKSASFRLNKGGKEEDKNKEKDKDKLDNGISEYKKKNEEESTLAEAINTIETVQVVINVVDEDHKESIINTDNSVFYCETYVFAAHLQKDKRPFYYDDMIRNYLATARARFLNDKRLAKAKLERMPSLSNTSISSASSSASSSSSSSSGSVSSLSSNLKSEEATGGQLSCVSPNCTSRSSVLNSYLCNYHYEQQRKQMANFGNKSTTNSTKSNNNTKTKATSTSPTLVKIFEPKVAEVKKVTDLVQQKSSIVQSTYSSTTANRPMEDYFDENLEKMKHFNNNTSFGDRLSREFCVPNSL